MPLFRQPLAEAAQHQRRQLARTVLASFLFTFLASRITVLLIMTRRIPDLYLHLGGNHVHHLNYGIFLLSAVGGVLLFSEPRGPRLKACGILYGIGLALTFDEFGMWLHLGGSYWQRASWDAIAVIGAGLALLAYSPALGRFRPVNWWVAVLLGLGLIVFTWLWVASFKYARHVVIPKLRQIETTAPQ